MRAAAALRVAQLSQCDSAAKDAGTGSDHRSPMTASTIGGTHSQWNSLLVGCWWLAPYSLSQSARLRMAEDANPRRPLLARRQGVSFVLGGHQPAQLAQRARLDLADALGGHAVLAGQLMQRRLVFGHPAPLHDVAAARIQPLQGAAQAV